MTNRIVTDSTNDIPLRFVPNLPLRQRPGGYPGLDRDPSRWPITILILSYVYGIWRLRKLGGPGVDEFQEDKAPPLGRAKAGF